MNAIIQLILSLFGQSDKSKIAELVMSVLLGGNKSGATSGTDGGAGAGGGLGDLMAQFQNKGLGEIFSSWVSTGQNQDITPDQVKHGIGLDTLKEMAQKSGLSMDDMAGKLAKYLPEVIDKMTPGGKLPGQ